MPSTLPALADPRRQRWAWWPLLPLYPYGRRPTLFRELVPGRVWCFEQLHGVWYVAVPIRMTVLKVEGGLLLYAPIPATEEVISGLRALEREHGPVLSIVLATSSGLEHKLPAPALSRAFPAATLWVSEHQWSFPLPLPSSWLGFDRRRTRALGGGEAPHREQLEWIPLGPLDLGLGTYHEVACFDRASGCLLVTDALVGIRSSPPRVFDLDPRPLLFHAREHGYEPMEDSAERRLKGWKRIVMFANFLRPQEVAVPPLPAVIRNAVASKNRSPDNHFGLYPFQWSFDWEAAADRFLAHGAEAPPFRLAPILERLVFVRSQTVFLDWLTTLSRCEGLLALVSCHYDAPIPIVSSEFDSYRQTIESEPWAPSTASWQQLASIDKTLLNLGLVPAGDPSQMNHGRVRSDR